MVQDITVVAVVSVEPLVLLMERTEVLQAIPLVVAVVPITEVQEVMGGIMNMQVREEELSEEAVPRHMVRVVLVGQAPPHQEEVAAHHLIWRAAAAAGTWAAAAAAGMSEEGQVVLAMHTQPGPQVRYSRQEVEQILVLLGLEPEVRQTGLVSQEGLSYASKT